MISFKEFWNKNSRIVLIALALMAAIAFCAVWFFGGEYSDAWIWLAWLGGLGVVLFIASLIDYNKTQK